MRGATAGARVGERLRGRVGDQRAMLPLDAGTYCVTIFIAWARIGEEGVLLPPVHVMWELWPLDVATYSITAVWVPFAGTTTTASSPAPFIEDVQLTVWALPEEFVMTAFAITR